jgi:hypothetical protein
MKKNMTMTIGLYWKLRKTVELCNCEISSRLEKLSQMAPEEVTANVIYDIAEIAV